MIGYETEEQQVQAIKQFWKDNGVAIVLGAAIGLGGLWGWRSYNEATVEAKETASAAYNESLDAFVSSQNTDALSAFISSNKDTGYAPLAALIVAQQAAEKDDFVGAKNALMMAIGDDVEINDIARIRLADVHNQLAEYDQTLSVLSLVSAASFADQVEELKGDALLAQGDFEAAKAAYTKALDEAPTNRTVKMKLDDIAYAANQVVSADSE